jgi:hypothetical protein
VVDYESLDGSVLFLCVCVVNSAEGCCWVVGRDGTGLGYCSLHHWG